MRSNNDPPACCSPRGDRAAAAVLQAVPSLPTATGLPPGASCPAISPSGGEFLMGTNYGKGFPADGEGPVRRVSLSAFDIDAFPVTNAGFAAFIAATSYRTEAEVFGWSFVFWSHISESRFEALVEDTAAHTPWWCKVPGSMWNRPEGPGSSIEVRLNHPVVHVSWNDAAAYAAWVSKALPTEASGSMRRGPA